MGAPSVVLPILGFAALRLAAADSSGDLVADQDLGVSPSFFTEGEEIPQHWEPEFVLLSAINAFVGAMLTAKLITLTKHEKDHRWYFTMICLSGFSLGVCCFWSTHYVGMRALRLGCRHMGSGRCVPMSYELCMGVLSGVVPSAISGMGVHAIAGSRDPVTGAHVTRWSRVAIAGVCTGTAVHMMHFLGMASQGGSFRMEWYVSRVVLCYVFACVAGTAAFAILFELDTLPSWLDVPLQLVKGLVIAGAVCFVHYFGMTAATYRYSAEDERISWYHWSNDEVRIGEFWITVVVTIFQLLLDLILEAHVRRQERTKATDTEEVTGAQQPQAMRPATGTLLGGAAAAAAAAQRLGGKAYMPVPESGSFADDQLSSPVSAGTAGMGA